jgi:FtsH-binding integral membrane protein
MQAVAEHPFISIACFFAPLVMANRARDAFPANIALVLLFTFVAGVFISPILYLYGRSQPGLITQAAVLTIGAFGVLTLYAFVSRRDFSAWGSFFMVGLWVLIGTMILNLFFRNPAMDLWLAGITVLVFSGLLVYDTWRIRNVYGPDEYVGAAVNIYLDLLNLFLGLLRVLGGRRS